MFPCENYNNESLCQYCANIINTDFLFFLFLAEKAVFVKKSQGITVSVYKIVLNIEKCVL